MRSGFENVGSVTGTFYPPVASPHDKSLHYSSPQPTKTSTAYSLQQQQQQQHQHQQAQQQSVDNSYASVQCSGRQQGIIMRPNDGQFIFELFYHLMKILNI